MTIDQYARVWTPRFQDLRRQPAVEQRHGSTHRRRALRQRVHELRNRLRELVTPAAERTARPAYAMPALCPEAPAQTPRALPRSGNSFVIKAAQVGKAPSCWSRPRAS
jgi:hypothetical protein